MRAVIPMLTILLLAGCGGGDSSQEQAVAAPDHRIDPEPFRAGIEAVEAVLYRSETPGYDAADEAGQAVMAVGAEVLRHSQDPHVREAGMAVLNLGGEMGSRGDVGYATVDLPALRRQWEDARNELFLPADWFQGRLKDEARAGSGAATAALDRAQTPPGPAPISDLDRHDLASAIDDFERLLRDGRRKCRELGEPDYDISVTTARSEAHVASWHRWTPGWQEKVRDAWPDSPRQPGFDAHPDLLMVWNRLEHASQQLQMATRGAGMWPTPFEAQWEQRFDAAQTALDEARDHLARVPVE